MKKQAASKTTARGTKAAAAGQAKPTKRTEATTKRSATPAKGGAGSGARTGTRVSIPHGKTAAKTGGKESAKADTKSGPKADAKATKKKLPPEVLRRSRTSTQRRTLSITQAHPFGRAGSIPFQRFGQMIEVIRLKLQDFHPRALQAEVGGLCEALSKSRTSTVQRDYLSDDLTQAAYVAHFLPWNVCRLLWMWQQSGLDLGEEKAVTVEDWGAGPLTGLIALWVSGRLDGRKVRYRGVERQRGILAWGQDIAEALGIRRHIAFEAARDVIDFEDAEDDTSEFDDEGADLLLVANAFNEWLPVRGRSLERVRNFAKLAASALRHGGTLQIMEPASRVVSWGVSGLRETMLELGRWDLIGPCTHRNACPLFKARAKAWCHFRTQIEPHPSHAPLVNALGIDRSSMSLSWLAARKREPEARENRRVARLMSDPIAVGAGRGVYGCSSDGRVLIQTREGGWPRDLDADLQQGGLVAYPKTALDGKDAVSWAQRVMIKDVRRLDGSPLGGTPSASGASGTSGASPTPTSRKIPAKPRVKTDA